MLEMCCVMHVPCVGFNLKSRTLPPKQRETKYITFILYIYYLALIQITIIWYYINYIILWILCCTIWFCIHLLTILKLNLTTIVLMWRPLWWDAAHAPVLRSSVQVLAFSSKDVLLFVQDGLVVLSDYICDVIYTIIP